MGVCDSHENDRVNEVETGNPLNEVDLNLIEVFPSVCKVKVKNLNGTGFFIKLYKGDKELFCLMTNEHVIREEYIISNETIYIYYEYQKKYNKIKLNQSERFIKFNKDLDVTIIEIIKADNVEDKYFLTPNLDNIIVNQEMYVAQFPEGKLGYSYGYIKEIDDYELTHDAGTKFGSSGSPICLKGTIKVIGIHKQGNIDKKENYGTLIHPIIELLQNEENDKKIVTKLSAENDKFGTVVNEDKLKRKKGETQRDLFDNILNGKQVINEKGDYYIGEYKDGKMHGKGTIFFKNGKIKYEGNFVNNKKEGMGKYFFEHGEYFINEGGKKYYLSNGDYYLGTWLNDKRYGIGKIFLKNGKVKYAGDFVNNKFEGNGIYIFEDGYYYIGQWMDDYQHGKGKIYDKNSKIVFSGDFIKDKTEGNGKLYFVDGGYFIGQFKSGKLNGKGKLFSKDGIILYELVFNKGKLISKEKKTNNNYTNYIEEIIHYSRCGKRKI